MSELILIRHGQATPFERDTDQLSPLGHDQARRVGRALAAEGLSPTHVLHGPLIRQRLTAQLAGETAGEGWPDPILDPRLAEYDGDGLIRDLAPLLASHDAEFARLVAQFQERHAKPGRDRAFQLMLEHLAGAWQAGEVAHPEVETWAAFRARVVAAFQDLLALPSGTTALVFTSGGVIGLMVALALNAPDSSALKLLWRVRNASFTRLTFSARRVSLDSFNEQGHLPPGLWSWR